MSANGNFVGYVGFEKLAAARYFAVRTGGLCNPGGVQKYLDLPTEELERIFGGDRECGDDTDIVDGKIIGVIRVSFGACSTVEEVIALVDFIKENYVVKG